MVLEIERGRLGFDTVKTATECEHFFIRRTAGGGREAAIERFVFSQVDYPGPEYRTQGGENSAYEGAHSQRDGDHARPIGAVVHRKKRKNARLISLFLDEANWWCCGDSPSFESLLNCGLAPRFGKQVEPHGMLIAVKGLDISHWVVSISFCGTTPLPGRIELTYFEPGKVRLLYLLESRPLQEIDAWRPFDRLDRRKATQQILGQMSKFGPGNRRWPGEGSLQLLEKDFLLGKVGIYPVDDLPGEEAEFKESLV